MRIAARWADEFNITSAGPEQAADRVERLLATLEAAGRDPASMTRSTMVGVLVGEDRAAVHEREQRLLHVLEAEAGGEAWLAERRRRWIMGTPDEARAAVERFATAGIERIMLQDFLPWDLEMIDLLGAELVGRV
jgi:alkanesulfonate monooxygenase SsuD/methylene tetrahydromethanopterin reductase-like flavin-dependent oxidoreductase (luciferase family)